MTPVKADFTLGLLTPSYPFHQQDFDPHVSGVVGYVFPGGGLAALTGAPNIASSVLSPGYQAPYPCVSNGAELGNGAIVGGTTGYGAQCNPPGAPTSSWYQLQGSAYAPFGAVLTGSTGDLIFALNATAGTNPGGTPTGGTACSTTSSGGVVATPCDSLGWSGVTIFLPPGFTLPTMDGSNVVTTVSNSYANIQVYKVSPYDRYAPGWTAVNIWTDGGESSGPLGGSGTSTSSQTYYNHQFINFTTQGEWYYFRINGVTAPTVAGRYFFKMLLTGDSNYLAGQEGTAANATASICSNSGAGGCTLTNNNIGEAPTQFIPTQNWPVLLVKAEIDPAIITGTVRYGGYNSTLYGQPIGEAGQVWAHMEDKIDPYTGQQITMCPAIGQPMVPGCNDARGYFNGTVLNFGTSNSGSTATQDPSQCAGPPAIVTFPTSTPTGANVCGAQGHYEVEGVAPGVYTIYAEAAGFPQQVCASGVTVLKGQSLHFDCYVQPGPVIHGNVFTKHQFGDEPWMGELPYCSTSPSAFPFCSQTTYNEYIKIELYDAPTLANIPDPSADPMVSWSPMPCVAGGQDVLYPKTHAGSCGDPRTASNIAFPWHEYTPANGYGACTATLALGYYQVAKSSNPTIGCTSGQIASMSLADPQGVGPPQHWFVQGGTTIPFHFEMGVKGEYGAPRDLDGQVPQVYATWVNGLTPGRYYVRAWVFRYVQTALDGSTFQEYYFDVTPQEWAGDVTLPIDLRLSSWVNKTVHFHDQFNSLIEDPINTGGGFMTGYLTGADGNIYSYNVTALGLQCTSAVLPTPLCSDSWGVPTGSTIGTDEVTNYPNGPGGSGWSHPDAMFGGWSGGFQHGFGYSGVNSGFGSGSGVNLAGDGAINQNAIQEGRANIQFWGINDTWSGENYGIPSGTYTPSTQVLGYIAQGPLEQVSVTLSGTVTSISDHMIRGPGFNVTVFSIDWERPTVNRAWEFGNPEGWNFIPGYFANHISGSSRSGYINSNNVGAEIDLGAYSNGTLADWTGDEPAASEATSINTNGMFQNQFENNVTLIGGGFPILNLAGNLFDANFTWFGSEVRRPGMVGGMACANGPTSGGSPFCANPAYTSGSVHNVNGLFNWPHQLEPTAFQPGQYDFGAYTYGYVQDQGFSVYADVAQIADVRLNLVIGVNITLDILFKKEHVITPTDFNMSGRVRIFNDQGQLVGEWMSSNGAYTPPNSGVTFNGVAQNGRAVAADGTVKYPFGPLHAVVPGVPGPGLPASQIGTASQQSPAVGSGLNEYNYIPGGITLLHTTISGLPQVPAAGYDAPPALPAGTYSGDPVFTPSGCDFELDCYAGGYMMGMGHGASTGMAVPGMAMGYPFPNTGIAGYPDYQGGWTAEVDFVPWYANNTGTPEAAAGFCTTSAGPGGTCQSKSSSDSFGQYYAPIQGLLLGESYHIIPGTTATSGISLTEDAALSSTFLGHSMVFNHLGPYSQEGVWQISGTHLSGEASGIFEVDLNGFISGTALAFTWANDFRPLSWATVSVVGASGATWNYYTFDGQYGMYLPGGSYSLTIASPGIASQTLSVAVTGGEVGTAGNVYMQQSNIPVPEFTGLAVTAFAALAASLYVLQRRRRK